MPELPDVETFRRYLDDHGLDREVERTEVDVPELLVDCTPQALGRRLKGHRLTGTHRHGKYLFANRDGPGGWVVFHFGMSGFLKAIGPDEPLPGYTRLLLRFTDGRALAYAAPRKLGMIGWTEDPGRFAADHDLGPDALKVGREAFVAGVQGHRGGIKCWLMDQSAIAGIGNIYSDEVLFQAGLHPRRTGTGLGTGEAERLHAVMQEVLETAIAAQANPAQLPEGYIIPVRGSDLPCPHCGGTVTPIKACGRTAWYCPRCQPEG